MRNDRRFDLVDLNEETTAADENPSGDTREPAERDRDRILYSEEFRRLAGITQVVAGDVGFLVRNRLTHVLEVAQIGQRLAQKLLKDPVQREIANSIGGVDPNVVEAACLAHDLGHPPFGHIAEDTLNDLADDPSIRARDGFEGNAQSFRIVTKLAEQRYVANGLALTRATLNALIKYPWPRGNAGKEARKWNFYSTEKDDFEWARQLDPSSRRKSAEAELMDWSDDIAYSVNDMEDFYKAGKIPLHILVEDRDETDRFLEEVFRVWDDNGYHIGEDKGEYSNAFKTLVNFFNIDRSYSGDLSQRHEVKSLTGWLIDRYICGIELNASAGPGDPFVKIDQDKQKEIVMLKELTWHYVIRDPALATQQYGQRKIIKGLFEVLYDACGDKREWHILPPRYREIANSENVDGKGCETLRFRLVSDIISGMSEQQAVALHQRLQGISPGSAFSSIMR